MTRSFPDFLSGSLKYVFWWPADRSQDDEWYRNNDRSNDGKPWPIAGAPARVLYCTLSPIHHLPTLAMVQSEVINGFFIRLVKSFYIKPRMAARMHDMTRTMHLLLSLPIDDHSFFSSPRPSARGSSTVFHLSPRGRIKCTMANPFLSCNDSFLFLSLSLFHRLRISSARRKRILIASFVHF